MLENKKEDGIWWWLDTGWGCGGIYVINNVITKTAPIFKKLLGKTLLSLPVQYKRIKIGEEEKVHSQLIRLQTGSGQLMTASNGQPRRQVTKKTEGRLGGN